MWAQAGLDVLSSWANLKGQPSDEESAYITQAIQRFTAEAERLRNVNLWHPLTQDRRVELVFIGDQRMQKDTIRAGVEDAMCTQEELGSLLDEWETLSSPQTPIEHNKNPFANVPRCVSI